jgi:hypothetical protein
MYADNHPCHRPYYAKGYCKQHYQTEPRDGGARFRKYGGPARDINDPDEPPISIPNFPDYSINPRGDVYNHKSGKWVDQTVDKLILVYDDRGEHSLDVAELLREVWGDWAVERYQNGGDE